MPSPPGDEDEDFILVHHSDVQISEKAEQVYTQLAKILKEQYEVNTDDCRCCRVQKSVLLLHNLIQIYKYTDIVLSFIQSFFMAIIFINFLRNFCHDVILSKFKCETFKDRGLKEHHIQSRQVIIRVNTIYF